MVCRFDRGGALFPGTVIAVGAAVSAEEGMDALARPVAVASDARDLFVIASAERPAA